MNKEQIKTLRILSSIPTHSIDEITKLPREWGSGCFIDYKKQAVFLTVYHTVENRNLTAGILVDFEPESGTRLETIGQVSPIYKFSLFDRIPDEASEDVFLKEREVDFYAKQLQLDKIPICKFFRIDESGTILEKVNRIIIPTELNDVPNYDEEYGFAGYIYGCPTDSPFVGAKIQKIWNNELGYYEGLKFKETCGNYHIFSLPNNDYEADDFRGMSGAPILDSKGKLVALVSRGQLSMDGNEWLIKGVNLKEFSFVVDVTCDLI